MISYVLIVFAMTAQGPVAKPVAAFENYQHCMTIAQEIVPQLQQQLGTPYVTAQCQERTHV